MINNSYVCVNGGYHGPIENLTGVPTPGKKIRIDGEALPIRCCLRYTDAENNIRNLYIDLIKEGKKQ